MGDMREFRVMIHKGIDENGIPLGKVCGIEFVSFLIDMDSMPRPEESFKDIVRKFYKGKTFSWSKAISEIPDEYFMNAGFTKLTRQNVVDLENVPRIQLRLYESVEEDKDEV